MDTALYVLGSLTIGGAGVYLRSRAQRSDYQGKLAPPRARTRSVVHCTVSESRNHIRRGEFSMAGSLTS